MLVLPSPKSQIQLVMVESLKVESVKLTTLSLMLMPYLTLGALHCAIALCDISAIKTRVKNCFSVKVGAYLFCDGEGNKNSDGLE